MASLTTLTRLLEEAFPPEKSAASSRPAERLRGCLARRGPTERARILEELHDLLGRGLCDMQMEDLIAFEMGCHLRPAEMGRTASEWLEWVGRQVALRSSAEEAT